MKKFLIPLLFVSFSFANGLVIDIGFEIDKVDNVKLTYLDVGQGEPQRFFAEESGSYEALIVDSNGQRLEGHGFDTSFWLLSDPPEELDYSDHSFRFNYHNTSDKLLIKHGNKIIFEKKLPSQGVCTENGICESGENAFGCFRDCDPSTMDGYCTGFGDGICDPDCSKTEDIDCITHDAQKPGFTCIPTLGLIFLSVVAIFAGLKGVNEW